MPTRDLSSRLPELGGEQTIGSALRRGGTFAQSWLSPTLVAMGLLILVVGWHATWPDLNRDFNHLHGWGECQDAQLARSIAEEGLVKLGFAPVVFKFFDAGDHYWYYAHYPVLPHAVLSVVLHLASPAHQHRALRLAGMSMALVFLLGVYLLGRELYGTSFAAWALFFAAVNAQTFFFSVFQAMGSLAILFAVFAYWSYLRWRRTGRRLPLVVCVASLCGGYLSDFFFYPAALPIIVDILCCYPVRTRRHTLVAGFLLLLPLLIFVAVQLHYRYGIALLTGKEVYSTGSEQNLAHRTHYELLLTFTFYKRLVEGCLWYLSPPILVGALAYYASHASSVLRGSARGSIARRWQDVFVILTLSLGACVLLFPQSTLDHEFTYQFLVLPMSLACAGAVYRLTSVVVKTAIAAVTVAAAFGNTAALKSMNNSPQWEFKTGVGLSLFTPEGSFVRTALEPNYYFMLLYYAHRNLLFHVPEELRPLNVPVRFDLAFGAPVAADACALFVPGTNAVVVDHTPELRPTLVPIHATYGNGAYEIVAARVTASYENMHLVEIAWRQNWAIVGSVGIEIGQIAHGQFVSLGRFTPRGGCADTSAEAGAPSHREVYFVETQHTGLPIIMRLFDPQSGRSFHDDGGTVDISLEGRRQQ
jgi:hypothetical protein